MALPQESENNSYHEGKKSCHTGITEKELDSFSSCSGVGAEKSNDIIQVSLSVLCLYYVNIGTWLSYFMPIFLSFLFSLLLYFFFFFFMVGGGECGLMFTTYGARGGGGLMFPFFCRGGEREGGGGG